MTLINNNDVANDALLLRRQDDMIKLCDNMNFNVGNNNNENCYMFHQQNYVQGKVINSNYTLTNIEEKNTEDVLTKTKTKNKTKKNSVLQGCVLSPSLFTIYTQIILMLGLTTSMENTKRKSEIRQSLTTGKFYTLQDG